MHELRALVVDDSKVGRITMLRKLEPLGIRVDLAESGVEALDYLARSQPDVIFMDHMMPDLDGFEVTRRIKAAPATRDIPVIIVSGNDEAAFIEEARQAGALDAIAKPPADDVLARLLASLPAPAAGPLAEAPPAAQPAPGLTEAQVRSMVEALLEGVEARVRAEFQARLDGDREHQEAALARLREQAVDAASLGGRLQPLEQQVRALAGEVAELGKATGAAPDAHALRAELESRFNDRLAEQAGTVAELVGRLPDLSPLERRLEEIGPRLRALEAEAGRPLPDLDALRAGLEQRIAAVEAQAPSGDTPARIDDLRQALLGRLDEQAAQVDTRMAELNARLEGLAGEVRRLAAELGDARSVFENRVGSLEAALESAREQALPDRDGARVAADETVALRAELADLRERLSEPNLRPLMADAVAGAPGAMPAATETEGLGAEVAQLRARLKRLATLTLVGGAVLLGAMGLLLVSGWPG